MIIGLLVSLLLTALVYWIAIALGLPSVVAIIAAILVLLICLPTTYYRFGGRRDIGNH